MSEPHIETPPTSPPPPANDVDRVHRDLSARPISSEYERESPPGTPRWVKGLGIAFVILALLFAGLHLTGNEGGPGSHGLAEHGMPMP